MSVRSFSFLRATTIVSRRSFCAAVALSVPLIANACAHTPRMQKNGSHAGEIAPPHLRAPADLSVLAGEHEHTDPVPDPKLAETVSLGEIFAYGDVHSPALAVARSVRARSDAARIAASPLLPANPEVTVAAGPRVGAGESGLDVEVSLMQQIQISGERGARLKAADRFGELTNAEIEQVRWLVHCEIHESFHRSLVEQERMRLSQRVLTFQQEVLRVVERQIHAGETAPLFLRLAQAEVAQAQQVFVAAQQAFFASRIRLAQVSGWPVESPPMPEGSVDAPRQPPSTEQLLSIARERLPILRSGAARIREAEARVTLSKREAWPRPSIGLQYAREGRLSSEGAVNVFMGAISLPIPSFQKNQGGTAHARADVAVATAELDAARRLLHGQIAEARSAVVAAASRSSAYGSEILPRFEENLTLLRRSFELGEIDILALSTGRERFLRIQSDALGAQLDYFIALAGLERAVGVDLWRDDHHEENTP